MDTPFRAHNTHWDDPKGFASQDPQLRRLKAFPYLYRSPLLDKLPVKEPGIYTLTGGRQIGKSTLLKQWMLELLQKKIDPQSIAFLSGELIDDQHRLWSLIQYFLDKMPKGKIRYLIIDEITYIRDWDKIIKYAADSGILDDTILMLTGSDAILLKEARMRFPGRRGKNEHVDFHLFPLSFRECVLLKHKTVTLTNEALFTEFNNYLQHGGFLTAINDFASEGKISPATLTTYSDWIRGDMLKRGKQEHYLREVLSAIIKRYTSQITWNALSKDLSIDHPKTVQDYVQALESMDVLFIQPALLEDKLTAAPKKPRKIIFNDPFIFHAINAWLNDNETENDERTSQLVEACAISHYHRYFPTYYIKAEGEVDIAIVQKNRFYPIEVKWTQQLRSKDLKQIKKYSAGKILGKILRAGKIDDVPIEPLPRALFELQEV